MSFISSDDSVIDKLKREKFALIDRLNDVVLQREEAKRQRDIARDMGLALERNRERLTQENAKMAERLEVRLAAEASLRARLDETTFERDSARNNLARTLEERDTNQRNYTAALRELGEVRGIEEALRGTIEHLKGRKAYYKRRAFESIEERAEIARKLKNVEIIRDAARLLDEPTIKVAVIDDALAGPLAEGLER